MYRYGEAFGFEIVKVVLDHKDLENKLEAAVKDAVSRENERLSAFLSRMIMTNVKAEFGRLVASV